MVDKISVKVFATVKNFVGVMHDNNNNDICRHL